MLGKRADGGYAAEMGQLIDLSARRRQQQGERLLAAIVDGDLSAGLEAVAKGADLSWRHAANPEGPRALETAIILGRDDLARHLVDIGAPLDKVCLGGHLTDAFVLASRRGKSRLLAAISQRLPVEELRRSVEYQLSLALLAGSLTEILSLLELCPEAATQAGNGGIMPLHLAASRGQVDIIDHLLACGAQWSDPRGSAGTPAQYLQRCHPELLSHYGLPPSTEEGTSVVRFRPRGRSPLGR